MIDILRRYPATTVAVILVVVFFPLQWPLSLVDPFAAQGVAMADGQWWRALTAFLVQGSGWGQFVFNTVGLVLVGAAVERSRGTVWWLGAALAAQLGTVAINSAWRPEQYDSGSSFVVGGLIGVLVLTRPAPPRWWAIAASVYAVFYASYLAALAVGGPGAGAVVGSVTAGVSTSLLIRARSAGLEGVAHRVVMVIVVVGAVVLIALRDGHGVALAMGLVITAITSSAGRAVATIRRRGNLRRALQDPP